MNSPIGAIAQMGERVNGIHEVGGSIPPGSTNLRRFAATVGKPSFAHGLMPCKIPRAAKFARRSPKGEDGR
jgi:hypothetical protein